MPVVYLDNFRGFENTYLPLKQINFFVGENSTGKTSILKLIKILSDAQFWFLESFTSGYANLGHFKEIISKSSKNRKNFTIGVLGEEFGDNSGLTAVLMKFKDENGSPKISEVSMILDNINIHAKTDRDLKYRIRKLNLENVNEKNKLKYFKWWINNNPLKNYRYTSVDKSENFKYPSNLMLIYSKLVERLISSKENLDDYKIQHIPRFLKNITWMAPIRAEPKRTYDSYDTEFSPEGEHSPYLLKELYDETKKKNSFAKIIEEFGRTSGLFEKIDINILGKNLKTAPFEIHITLKGTSYKLPNVGYGISQILPILVEIATSDEETWFSIQQPEIHIHPKAQAAFGEFMFNASKYHKKSFIIETHSDFIIDRFRFQLHSGDDKNSIDSQVVFFQKDENGNKLKCIPIQNNGKYAKHHELKFREFFINEDLNTIQI